MELFIKNHRLLTQSVQMLHNPANNEEDEGEEDEEATSFSSTSQPSTSSLYGGNATSSSLPSPFPS